MSIFSRLPKAMSAAPFVPARNSRHRHAALALCRALIRQGRCIPLPKDVGPTSRKAHPVQTLVLRQFRRNKAETSPRLVFAALTAGYKFLSLFKQAQDPSSPSFDEVASYIRTHPQPRVDSASARKRAKAALPSPPRPPPLLLEKVARDGSVSYDPNPEARPYPFEALTEGRRHIPQLVVTSEGMPFLRFTKPQPQKIHHLVARHRDITQHRTTLLQSHKPGSELGDDAREEDQWDQLVAKLEAQEADASRPERREGTYEESVGASARFLQNQLNEERWKQTARTQGLLRIIDMEKKALREEAASRLAKAKGGGSKPPPADAPPETPAPKPTPRPRGRPRKINTETFF